MVGGVTVWPVRQIGGEVEQGEARRDGWRTMVDDGRGR